MRSRLRGGDVTIRRAFGEATLLSWNDHSLTDGAEPFANLPQMQEANKRTEVFEAPETVWRQPQEAEPRS
jgi:hypothetical protein